MQNQFFKKYIRSGIFVKAIILTLKSLCVFVGLCSGRCIRYTQTSETIFIAYLRKRVVIPPLWVTDCRVCDKSKGNKMYLYLKILFMMTLVFKTLSEAGCHLFMNIFLSLKQKASLTNDVLTAIMSQR